MTDRLSSISRDELNRRAALVRDRLKSLDAGALVVVSSHNEVGGYGRWLTDATVAYRRVVVVHRDELMSIVEHGSAGEHRVLNGDQEGYLGVGELYQVAAFPSVHYTQGQEGRIVAEILRRRGYRRVVLINPGDMPSSFIREIESNKAIEFIDDSDYFDAAKATKSVEEQEHIRAAARLQDEAFAATIAQIKVGMRDFEISAVGDYEAKRRGGHFGVVLTGSGAQGRPAIFRSDENRGRRTQPGDALSLLIENGSPSGYYLEVARPVVFGSAWQELRESFEKTRRLQAFLIDLMEAGTACRDIHQHYLDYVAAEGLRPERRVFSHGQGFEVVERPLIRDDEPMVLAAGMCLAVHPPAVVGSSYAALCDNILVTSGKPEALHKTEKRIFQISN